LKAPSPASRSRKALDLTSWQAAQNGVRECGDERSDYLRPSSVADAVDKFLADAWTRLLKGKTVLLSQRFLCEQFAA